MQSDYCIIYFDNDKFSDKTQYIEIDHAADNDNMNE